MADPTVESRFNEIYDATYKSVMSYIASKCGNVADMSDIAQETYMQVYAMLCKHGVGYARSDTALVLKIAQRKIARHYSRTERLRMLVPLYSVNEDGDETPLPELEAQTDAFMTEDCVVDRMMVEQARRLISQKPEDVKKVYYLFFDLGLTIAEIAKQLSMSESNVKHKLYRTLGELRGLLQ
jgi:RNA polymerase sigma-70 factor (ECF subfamily)